MSLIFHLLPFLLLLLRHRGLLFTPSPSPASPIVPSVFIFCLIFFSRHFIRHCVVTHNFVLVLLPSIALCTLESSLKTHTSAPRQDWRQRGALATSAPRQLRQRPWWARRPRPAAPPPPPPPPLQPATPTPGSSCSGSSRPTTPTCWSWCGRAVGATWREPSSSWRPVCSLTLLPPPDAPTLPRLTAGRSGVLVTLCSSSRSRPSSSSSSCTCRRLRGCWVWSEVVEGGL